MKIMYHTSTQDYAEPKLGKFTSRREEFQYTKKLNCFRRYDTINPNLNNLLKFLIYITMILLLLEPLKSLHHIEYIGSKSWCFG